MERKINDPENDRKMVLDASDDEIKNIEKKFEKLLMTQGWKTIS